MPRQQNRRITKSFYSHAAVFLLGCCFTTLILSVFHFGSVLHNDAASPLEHHFDKHVHSLKSPSSPLSSPSSSHFHNKPIIEQQQASIHHQAAASGAAGGGSIKQVRSNGANTYNNNDGVVNEQNSIAGLNCDKYGGPPPDVAQEMVYWRDIEVDNKYESPFHNHMASSSSTAGATKYMTFEPDGGGWNNIRMSMETCLTIAVATGRTLVLPPSQQMYLLGHTTFSFADFFPLHEIADEHPGLDIITMEEFLQRVVKHPSGMLRDKTTHQVSFPPDKNRTNWDGDTMGVYSKLNPWLQSVSIIPNWDPTQCFAAFPSTANSLEAIDMISSTFNMIQTELHPQLEDYINMPTPVNASMQDRMSEFLAGRKEICLYDVNLQNEELIHFTGKKKLGGRLLVHFYAFLFFQDYKEDLWMKRFVRDHIRYVDEIQCAAARVVQAVREHAKSKGNVDGSGQGVFDSFHIRRGDFQYKKTRVSSRAIYERSMDVIPEGATVYVGTDERDKAFFKDMADHWDLLYLDDFMHLVKGIDKNYYGKYTFVRVNGF